MALPSSRADSEFPAETRGSRNSAWSRILGTWAPTPTPSHRTWAPFQQGGRAPGTSGCVTVGDLSSLSLRFCESPIQAAHGVCILRSHFSCVTFISVTKAGIPEGEALTLSKPGPLL